MRRMCRITILAVACHVAFGASLAMGQFGYYPRADGGYSGDGAWGLYSSAATYAATSRAYEANRLASDRAALAQSELVQGNIRNMQTAQAEYRTQDIVGQQQANRNWWFQVQQQQAQRQPTYAGRTTYAAPVSGFESAPSTAVAATDSIIKWPPLLCQPEFAKQRALVEAPYRSKGAKADPTVADYETMIEAVEQMRAIMRQMATTLVAQEYLDTDAFLTQLAAEAQGRIEAIKAKSKTKPSAR